MKRFHRPEPLLPSAALLEQEDLEELGRPATGAGDAAASSSEDGPCTVVLVGPPGAGKTTIARRLSRALNMPMVDSDHLIEEEFGKPCGEVFSELGEEKFREVEARIIAEALPKGGVISLGGGAVLTESTRELLESYEVVWIDVSVEEGVRRTLGDNTRPVLQAADPAEHYRKLMEIRAPLYSEVACFRVRTDKKTPQQCVGDILSYVEAAFD